MKTGQSDIPFIGLAKRQEQIVVDKLRSNITIDKKILNGLGGFLTETEDYVLIDLPLSTNLIKLLQRIRDESHRFAVSYHSTLKIKRQTTSLLDDIPGIGPATRKKLQVKFGGLKNIQAAGENELIRRCW